MKVNKRTTQKINKCKRVYLVVCYAKWTVREFPWTGKFVSDYANNLCPEVWDYDDHNGEFEEYAKRSIYNTTTGNICTWTFNKYVAERIANALQHIDDIIYKDKGLR